MMNKRGLSEVVTTVLLMLLVVVAIITVWAFIRNSLFGAGSQIEATLSQIKLSIPENSIAVNKTTTMLSFSIERKVGSGPALSKVLIALKDRDNKAASMKINLSLKELEIQAVGPINYSVYNLEDIAEIAIAPVILTSSGKEAVGIPTSSYLISKNNEVTIGPYGTE